MSEATHHSWGSSRLAKEMPFLSYMSDYFISEIFIYIFFVFHLFILLLLSILLYIWCLYENALNLLGLRNIALRTCEKIILIIFTSFFQSSDMSMKCVYDDIILITFFFLSLLIIWALDGMVVSSHLTISYLLSIAKNKLKAK